MESTEVVAVENATAPVVSKTESSFSESSQQVKVEQVTNGTVETSVSQQKAVSQKMESSVQQISGGEQSSVKVEEMKQESFSSSSVVMENVITTGDGLVVTSVEPLPAIEPVAVVPQPSIPAVDVNNNVVAPEVVKQEAPVPKPIVEVPVTPVAPVVEQPAPVVIEKPVEIPAPAPKQQEPVFLAQTEAITKEIQQENIKKQLNEIITDIEQHVNVNDEDPTEFPHHDAKLDPKNPVDLQKIFTPAHDAEEIVPGKNQTRETKENGFDNQMNGNLMEPKKVPLKLLMDPRGHVHDFQTMRQFGYEQMPGPMSPEFSMEIVNALNAPKGKGAELFAKRRKKAEKWVVDGSSVQQRTTPTTTPTASATILAFSDVGTQRVQRNIQMDQIQQRILNNQPRVQMVKSPWEAALETGSANNAFVSYDQAHQQPPLQQQQQQYQPVPSTGQIYSGTAGQQQQYEYGSTQSSQTTQSSLSTQSSFQSQITKKNVEYQSSKQIMDSLSKRDLAYKPNVPQGWNRPVVLSGVYTPPEIPVYNQSSTTTEKYSKFSSQSSSSTTTQSGGVGLPNFTAPLNETPAMVQAPPPQQQQQQPAFVPKVQPQQSFVPKVQPQQLPPQPAFLQKAVQHPAYAPKPQAPKPIQNSVPQSFPSKSPVHFNQAPLPQQQPCYQAPPTVAISAAPPSKMSPSLSKQRANLNASPVTPGILKKQIQLDAAVPLTPGSGLLTTSTSSHSISTGKKSPIPIFNTTAAPFGFPAGSLQTPDTIAQLAPISPAPSPMPRNMQSTKPLPLIVSTPIPKYTSNYNNAASGFGVYKDYYRPIHMQGGKKLVPPTVYTDF